MPLTASDGLWVAVQVRVSRERGVADQLAWFGYESFSPCYVPSLPDQKGDKEKALFPGYLFCRFATNNKRKIIEASGVIRIVANGASVSEEEITAIRRVVDSGFYSEPWRNVESGERVRVCSGPLSGLFGTVLYTKKGLRLVIGVQLLQRYVAVEVNSHDVLPYVWPRPMPTIPLAAEAIDSASLGLSERT